MTIRQLGWAFLGALFFALAFSAPASAQATRTWVSGVGDDANPCSRTAPCKTFAGAISKTATSGEIDCLDPGGFGAVTITKSITIDCTGTFGSILNSATNGVIINATAGIVRLRGISIDGAGTTLGINGIRIITAKNVFVEDVVIMTASGSGIRDERTGGTNPSLHIIDTTINNVTGSGISLACTVVCITEVDNVRSSGNGTGIGVGTNNKAVVSRSVFANNATSGASVDAGGFLTAMSSQFNGNATGIVANGPVSVADSEISLNANAISGTVFTFGNNRVAGNTSITGTFTAVGAASTDLGQR